MNQFPQSIYQPYESVGALTMVSVDQIQQDENLDYLQHLCTFIDRMNINPLWFEQETAENKLKLMEIYQLAINYSKNLSNSYKEEINRVENNVEVQKKEVQQKVQRMKDHKEKVAELKLKYKFKKHKIYKLMYNKYKDRLQEEEYEEEESRHGKRTHRNRSQMQNQEEPVEIVYYYPGQGYPPPHDPRHGPYPQYNYPPPPPGYAQPYHQVPHSNGSSVPINHMNPNQPPYQHSIPIPQQQQPAFEQSITNPYTNYLDAPFANSGYQPMPPHNYGSTLNAPGQPNYLGQTEDHNILDHSDIIKQGPEVVSESLKRSQKSKDDKKSLSKASINKNNMNEQSRSRNIIDDDDDFGNLTLNSKKKTEGSIPELSNDMEQYDFDSIANIRLGGAESKISKPNQFQSKIKPTVSTIEKKPPKPLTSIIEKAKEENADSNIKLPNQPISPEKPKQSHKYDLEDSDDISSMPSMIMNSKFSSNNRAPQPDQVHGVKPKRNSQQTSTNSQKLSKQSSSKIGSQKAASEDFLKPPSQNSKISKQKLAQSTDIFTSNVGQQSGASKSSQEDKLFSGKPKRASQIVGPSQNEQKAKVDEKSTDIYSSNVGQRSGNSKASQTEKVLQGKPKRASQIIKQEEETPPKPSIDKKSEKPSNNNLIISMAESERLQISTNPHILESQAVSIRFNEHNKIVESNTPPALPKEKAEQSDEYNDDFEDGMDLQEMMLSKLPTSKNNSAKEEYKVQQKPAPPPPKMESSQVNIIVSSLPSVQQVPVKDLYAKIQNQTFTLVNPNKSEPKKIQNNVGKSKELEKSDDLFDEILQIPEFSKIARRPSMIHKFQPSKIVKPSKAVESLKQIPTDPKISDSSMNSNAAFSINLIDPQGHKQKLQAKKSIKEEQNLKNSGEDLHDLSQLVLKSKKIQPNNPKKSSQPQPIIKKDSLKENPKQKPKEKPEEYDEQFEDQQIDQLLENSIVSGQIYKQEEQQKILAKIRAVNKASISNKDPSKFNMKWIDTILQDKVKLNTNNVPTADKWKDIQKVFDKQLDKIKTELNKKQKFTEEKLETTNLKNTNNESDDLKYSISVIKNEPDREKKQVKKVLGSIDPIKDMTISLDIRDDLVRQEKPSPKVSQNKYLNKAGSKKEQQKKAMNYRDKLVIGIKQGNNYDKENPLNNSIAQFLKHSGGSEQSSEFD